MKFLTCLLVLGIVSTSLGSIIDVVVQDLGCWKENPSMWAIESWEGKHPMLDGPHEVRIDPVQKCAKVAQKLGYRVFAIREGGLCATNPFAEFNYTRWGSSFECLPNGRGGPKENQVYLVDTIIDAKFVPLGSWMKMVEDLERLEGRFIRLNPETLEDRSEPEEKCARAAAALKFEIFGLNDKKECFAWRKTLEDLRLPWGDEWGIPDDKWENLQFYHLTFLSNVTIVNLGCWKIDPLSRIIPLIESRSDILGMRDFQKRDNAVERCAIYNADWNHGEIFAVTNGGACAGSELREPAYDFLGSSDECPIDGKGAKEADQVYKLVREVKKIEWKQSESFTPIHMTSLGCWKVIDKQLIPSLEKLDEIIKDEPFLREDAVEKCARVAWKFGFDVIAIREGKCLSSPNARKLFRSYGPSDECLEDMGNAEAISVFELNTIRDPWFSNKGCFEDCEQIELLEDLHPLLKDEPRTRVDQIRKCSLVASMWEFDSFALLDGGRCHGLWWNETKRCVKSAACSDDGLGGRFAIQIYKIKAKNNFTLENLGCWKDDAFRTIPIAEGVNLELIGRYSEREDAIGACARYARSRGFKVFALQAGGMCLTSEHAEDMYNWYGWSNRCENDGRGGAWSNQVWKISDEWWKSPVDWWKVPEDWQKFGRWNCTWQWWKTPTTPWI
uniref:uncharacterized protein LOC120328813 n=1 Tax=Styela clava TaxID=7725 RepID=UPI00193A8DBA|nr:uncharacterized protein LOC120328813 [Styela clava]